MSRSRIIAGKAVIIIEAKDALDKSLAGIRAKLHKFANTAGAIGDTLFRTGFFGAIATGAGLRHFGKFDDLLLELQVSMNKLDPAARKVDKEMMSLEKTIRELGKSTSFTTIEVAAAAVRLAKAGLGGTQIEKSLQSILDLARGTSTDLETSANIFIRAISAFTKNGTQFNQALSESNKIVSQFVLATRAGVLDLTDLEAGLRYVQGTAGSLNISLAETLAVLTELSNKGLVGSIGGTSLNTALNNLAKKQEDIEKSLQIKFVISPEGDVNFLGTLDKVFNALKNVGSIKRTQILGDIFNLRGTRAIQAANAVEKIDELRIKLASATDQARKSAVIMDQGIGGTFRLMKSAIEDLNIELEKMAQGPVIVIAEIIKQLATDLNKLSTVNPLASTLIVLSPGILLGAGLGFMALSKALRVAAVAAGAFKSAYGPLANLLTKGTAGQISSLMRIGAKSGTAAKTAKAATSPSFLSSLGILGTPKAAGGPSAALVRAQASRASLLAAQRLAKANALGAAAEAHAASATAKTKDAIRQVNVARTRSNMLLAENAKRTKQAIDAARLQTTQYRAAIEVERTAARASLAYALGERQKAVIAERVAAAQRNMANLTVAAQNAERKWATARKRDLNNPYNRESLRIAGEARRASIDRLAVARAQASATVQAPAMTRAASEAAIKRNAKVLATLNARQGVVKSKDLPALLRQRTVLLEKSNKLERISNGLGKAKGVIETRRIGALTKVQDMLLSVNKAELIAAKGTKAPSLLARAKSSTFIGGGGRSILSQMASGAGMFDRGGAAFGTRLLTFGKSMLTVANIARRFVFSFSGVLTIVEGLILFGDRIPIVSDILTRFGKAFSGAFSEIGKVATYALGPIEQFKVAFEAFSKRQGDIGIEQLKKGFMGLVDIVGNQLVAAWNRFKEALGPVWDTVRQIAGVLSSTFEFLRQIVSINLGEFAASIGGAFSGLTSLFNGDGNMSFVSIFQAVVKGLLSGIATIATELNKWVFTFISASDDFLFKLEQVFLSGAQLIPGSSAFVNFAKIQEELNARRKDSVTRRVAAAGALDANNSAFQKRLDAVFNQASSSPASKKAADTANALSQGISQRAFADAEAARKKLYQSVTPPTPGNVPQALQPSGTQVQQIQQAKRIGIAFASALVGSAASTRGNILRFGKEIEEKQLEVMTDIRDDLRKIGNNEGVLTFD